MSFEVAGNTYEAGQLNVIQQLNLARRLTSAFSKQLPKLQELITLFKQTEAKKGDEELEEMLLKVVVPFADALGSMTDADVEYITKTCFGCIKRKTPGGWQRITAPNTADLMYQDIRGMTAITLIWKAVEANLSDFFNVTPPTSSDQ